MRIATLFLLPAVLCAQISAPLWNGWIPNGVHAAQNMNTAATWHTYRFSGTSTSAVSRALYFLSSVTSPSANSAYLEVVEQLGPNPTLTVTYTGNIVNCTGCGFAAGDTVMFSAATTLPTNITNDRTAYRVCSTDLTANSFGVGTGYSGTDCTGRITDFSGSAGTQAARKVIDTCTMTPAALWNECTFPGVALTAGRTYAVILRNIAAVPGTNTFQIRYYSNGQTVWGIGSTANHSPTGTGMVSTTGGTTWGTLHQAFYRIEFADGTYLGLPVESIATSTGVGVNDRAYDTREPAGRCVVPSSGWRMVGVTACFSKIGAPAANLAFKAYTGSDGAETILATTGTARALEVQTAVGCIDRNFAAVQVLSPGTVVRLAMAPTATGDTSGNSYAPNLWTVRNDSNSLAMMPCTYGLNVGGSWSYDPVRYMVIAPKLDYTNPFNPAAAVATGTAYVQ